jgi:hypothetical protein
LEKYFKYVESETIESFDLGKNLSKLEITFAMYAISYQAFRKANLNKRAAYQIYKMLRLFKCYNIDKENHIQNLSIKAISLLWQATDSLNVLELNKRKKDFGKKMIEDTIPLQYLLVDNDITMIWIMVKELELKSGKMPENLEDLHIASPYGIIYSIPARIFQLRFKSYVNFDVYYKPTSERDKLIAESIFCLKEIIRLSKTLGETYLFNHSFMGLIHRNLSFWIREYEAYQKNYPNIDKLLKRYLDDGWKEQLSGHYENKQALSHYYKCLETHREGKAYHAMIDSMHYVKDDFNDRSDHFSIALERHKILNGEIEKKIKELKEHYKDSASNNSESEISKLYKVENYFR